MTTPSDKRSRTALVLGAGGLVGEAYEAGVLAGLHEALGWDARSADLIVGTSAGSLVGSLLRCGLSPDDLLAFERNRGLSKTGDEILAKVGALPSGGPSLRLPRRPRMPSPAFMARALRHPWSARAGILCAALPVGRMDTTPYAEKLRLLTGDSWPEKDLWVVAAQLPSGKRVVLGTKGCPPCDVPLAVSASCAIPGVFAPVHIDGRMYVDGGVHSPTNADVLAGKGFDSVIVVSPMSASRPSLRRARVNPMRVFFRALLAAEMRRLRATGAEVIVFQPSAPEQRVMGVNGLDQSRCAKVAQLARETTLKRLERTPLREIADGVAA